jgi:osmotically-inducible protein OsmY
MTDRPLDEYVEAEVQRTLTEDVGVAEQGITVERRENTLVLCGEVESTARRDEVLRVVSERFPGVRIAADIGVIRAGAPTEAEELA